MLKSLAGRTLRRAAELRRASRSGEMDISLNRLVFIVAMIIYVAVIPALHAAGPVMVLALLTLATIGFLCHQLWRPAQSSFRILLGLVSDLGLLSCALHVGGGLTAVLYPMFLWIVLGNGFRFGVRFLMTAMALAVAGFAAAAVTTPYWRDQPALSLGLGIGLIILPLYATTLIRKLSQAKEAAEEASRAKTQFLASVSHELRTPLNAIIGFGQLLGETGLDSEQAGMVRTMTAAGRTLLAMISNILDFSRLEAGRMPRQAEDFCLRALLAEVRDMVAAAAATKGLRLGLHITARTPPRLLHGERGHLQEILLNLAANAVKFTAQGEVVIAADVAADEAGRVILRCEVSDTGIGIAPEARERIFERFTQADASVLNHFGGTGLGLAICQKLAHLMEGEIGVESTLGRGSTFWCEIPLQLAQGTAADDMAEPAPIPPLALITTDPALALRLVPQGEGVAPQVFASLAAAKAALAAAADTPPLLLLDERHPEAERGALAGAGTLPPIALVADATTLAPGLGAVGLRAFASTRLAPEPAALRTALALAAPIDQAASSPPVIEPSGRSLHILLAEDNRTNQKVVTKILERAGHTVQIAENGEQALDALEAERFDLVLMDVNMPVMSGLEAAKLHRFSELGGERVPIVALTADATEAAAEQCREAGMDDCLTKPIEPDRLLRALAAHVPDAPLVAAASPAVTEITSHPRFRPASAGVIDAAVLADLHALGGNDFVIDLIDSFLADSSDLVAEMAAAAAAGDSNAFRAHAHALRSAAANIGAKSLFELCLSWRLIRSQELNRETEALIPRLNAEIERVRAQLLAHRAHLAVNAREG